ncbi:MAG: S1 RNA-binding domain-containing protein [Candidatus Micrarchaeota archaeon]|nr:S1 RNA-binding domain-containing protein [Candidatus Micrarchaeota archaeon]
MNKNFPKLDELVLAKIKKIMNYGAICTLDEYNNQEAFLHISEVAPRWIKNIREFLHEGQTHVVRVINVDIEKGQVDVSLKKVTEYEAKNKIKEYRQEKRAKKIFELAIKEAAINSKRAEKLQEQLEKKYNRLYLALEEIQEPNFNFLQFGLNEEEYKKILTIVQKNIKKSTVQLIKIIRLISYSQEGIKKIKELLLQISKMSVASSQVNVHYLGAPRYQLSVISTEPKKTSKEFDQLLKKIASLAKEYDLIYEIEEKENVSSS